MAVFVVILHLGDERAVGPAGGISYKVWVFDRGITVVTTNYDIGYVCLRRDNLVCIHVWVPVFPFSSYQDLLPWDNIECIINAD